MKSNKSISLKIFLTKFHFFNLRNGQKSIFELGKLPKMQFHGKKKFFLTYLISRVFLPQFFFNFLTHCVIKQFALFPIEWTEFLDRAFRSIIPTILGDPNDNRTCLDIGCGPSISNVISGRYKSQTKIFFQHFKIFLCVKILF